MAILREGKDSFLLIERAHLVNEEQEQAANNWASKYMTRNPSYKWVIGNYAEAGRANRNRTLFQLDGLKMAQPTIKYAPMNIDHHQKLCVGTWVGSELISTEDEQASETHPHLSVVGPFWKSKFPNIMPRIEAAYDSGMLTLSMEAIGETVTCVGGCGGTFDFHGPQHHSYCDCINEKASDRQINNPTFRGGALVLPPKRPGWVGATVDEMASLQDDEEMAKLYNEVETTFPGLDAKEWEKLSFMIQLRSFEA